MEENSVNINIFRGAPADFLAALPLFSKLGGLILPVAKEPAGPVSLYTIAPFTEGGLTFLPAFTNESLAPSPFIKQPISAAALLFFHAPDHESFIFDPSAQAGPSAAPLKASRRDVSLLAGFARGEGKRAGGPPLDFAPEELTLGNLHSAHYLYALAGTGTPAPETRLALSAVLIELGLFQEAYELLKADASAEARLYLAMVYRRAGDIRTARGILSAVKTDARLEEFRTFETAWLDIEEGKEETAEKSIQRMAAAAEDKTEALFCLGTALAKTAFKKKDKGRLAAAAGAFRSALAKPSPTSGRIFFQLGNLYFRSGDIAQAETCYRRSAFLSPSVQALANLALCLLKTDKTPEAAQVTAQVALTDIASARKLVAQFPQKGLTALFHTQEPAGSRPEPALTTATQTGGTAALELHPLEPVERIDNPAEPPAEAAWQAAAETAVPEQPAAGTAVPEQPADRSDKPAGQPVETAWQAVAETAVSEHPADPSDKPAGQPAAGTAVPEQPAAETAVPEQPADRSDKPVGQPAAETAAPEQPAAETAAPEQPADRSADENISISMPQLKIPVISVRNQPAPDQFPPLTPPALAMETLQEVMLYPSSPTEEESRKDDFISRAFSLASSLEDELSRKVYFNLDGLNEVERKLRLAFIKSKGGSQANLETVKNSAAFLCYFLQERNKGRLIKMEDFDPWGWPMIFDRSGEKIRTYPVQRAWRLLWEENLPDPGWLANYSSWIADRLRETASPVCGAAAVNKKIMSHPERIADAQTEHKRILILLSSLHETSRIELSRTGLEKMAAAIRSDFRPGIPPTSDGWKLLRCYGHLLAEILIKDFKAAWFNVDGEDGGWSMRLPWKVFLFPLGKVYRTAAERGDLLAYYDALMSEKLRYQ